MNGEETINKQTLKYSPERQEISNASGVCFNPGFFTIGFYITVSSLAVPS